MTLRIDGEGVGHVHLTLTCDVPGCGNAQTFEQLHYVAQRRAASEAGWRERQTSAGREFTCPKCGVGRRAQMEFWNE